ncbi:MAG TPA: hypothetical protein VFE12_18915 [Acetobacteraceae bacterium]|nr:hypothetical protein [Acetobacteraceae bacterium]
MRRSEYDAAWWLGTALRRLFEASGLRGQQVDGHFLSTRAPDGPPPFTQYVGLSARFLETLPTGGAGRSSRDFVWPYAPAVRMPASHCSPTTPCAAPMRRARIPASCARRSGEGGA